MNKLILSLAALAALSSVALASDRSYELRDSDTYFGKFATNSEKVSTYAAAVLAAGSPGEDSYHAAAADLDFFLRCDGHRRP